MVFNCSTSITCPEFLLSKAFIHEESRLQNSIDSMVNQLQDCFGRSLKTQEIQDVNQAFRIMNSKTSGKKLPRLFQMRTALEIVDGRHVVVRAGTGSGKSIAMGLPMLLRPEWVFVTIAPLMALQKQHVSTLISKCFISACSLGCVSFLHHTAVSSRECARCAVMCVSKCFISACAFALFLYLSAVSLRIGALKTVL